MIPSRGRPIVTRVIPRDEMFSGPHVERALDLLLELRLDRGYSYNLMPSPPEGMEIDAPRARVNTWEKGQKSPR